MWASQDCSQELAASRGSPGNHPPQPTPPSVRRLYTYLQCKFCCLLLPAFALFTWKNQYVCALMSGSYRILAILAFPHCHVYYNTSVMFCQYVGNSSSIPSPVEAPLQHQWGCNRHYPPIHPDAHRSDRARGFRRQAKLE